MMSRLLVAAAMLVASAAGLVCNRTDPCYNHALNLCCPGDKTQHDGHGRPFCDIQLTGTCQNQTTCYDITSICVCGGDRPCRSASGACLPWSNGCSKLNAAMQFCPSGPMPSPIATTPTVVSPSPDKNVVADSFDSVANAATTITIIVCLTLVCIAAMVLFCICRRKPVAEPPILRSGAETSDREEALLPPLVHPRHASSYAPTHTTSTVASFQSQGSSQDSALSSSREFDLCELEMYRIQSFEISIVKALAQGAHGEVCMGMYQGIAVAVKKMLPKSLSHDEVQKFVLEIKLMAKLNSSYIVRFIGASWLRPSDIMLVTEFMDMGDLRNFLQLTSDATLSWQQKLQLALDIVHGLVYLHSLDHKIIHRDLKSRNVLLNTKLSAKLTDFGISREMDDMTMTAGIGTYRWMAPEVLQDGHYAESADMFSFGVILSELSTHQLPYSNYVNGSGRPYTDTAIMARVMMGDFQPTFADDCPEWFKAFGKHCMAFQPDDRPRAAQAAYVLQTELRKIEATTKL